MPSKNNIPRGIGKSNRISNLQSNVYQKYCFVIKIYPVVSNYVYALYVNRIDLTLMLLVANLANTK